MMLTGKDIHTAFTEHDSSARTWDDVTPKGQLAYNAVAEKLNGYHIAPLQGLVKDYQEFTKYATPLLKAGRLEWEAESNALFKRAQALLAEKER